MLPASLAAVCALLVVLALALPAAASADSRFGETGAGAGQLLQPEGLAVSAREAGDVYLADASNQRIDQFDPSKPPAEQFVAAFGWDVDAASPEERLQRCTTATGCRAGSAGSHPGQFSFASAVAVDNSCAQHEPPLTEATVPTCAEFDPSYGDLYVTDTNNFRIEKFSPGGQFLLMFGGEVDQGPHHPGNLCTAAFIAEGDTCAAGVPGAAPGFFEQPTATDRWASTNHHSIAVGPDGRVYVGDFRRVQEFEPSGAYLATLTMPEAEAKSQFVNSLAVDPSGHLFAGSTARSESQEISPPPSGTYTLTFEGQTTAPLNFNASEHEIEVALEALSTIGAGNLEVASGAAVFKGALAHQNVPQILASAGSVTTDPEGAAGELVELGPSGQLLRAFDPSGKPTHIALDALGDLFLVDLQACAHPAGSTQCQYSFQAYKPSGELYAAFTSPQVDTEDPQGHANASFGNPAGLAVDPAVGAAGTLYVSTFTEKNAPENADHYIAAVSIPPPGAPVVSAESATNPEPTTATLRALLNANGFDTEYRFQYLPEAACKANEAAGHECFLGAEQTPPTNIGAVIRDQAVAAPVSGLAPQTAYRFRAVAESEAQCEAFLGHPCLAQGEEDEAHEEIPRSFETLPPVSVRGFGTQTVAPEEVVLKAELSNNNSLTKGHWKICLGTEAGAEPSDFSLGCKEGELPAGSSAFEAIEVAFTGLRPNTEYHYGLFVENSYTSAGHPEQTPDAAFTTELSAAEERAAEDCPENGSVRGELKSALREQNNSTALPDCRAYEQVSPPDKSGTAASPTVWQAPSGERVLFKASGAFAGAVNNEVGEVYVAHRAASGWSTRAAVGRPAGPGQEPSWVSVLSPELDRWIFPESPGLQGKEPLQGATSATLYLGDDSGAFHLASPTLSLLEVEGGAPSQLYFSEPFGASDDLSRLYIPTVYRLLPEPEDPRPGDNNESDPTRIYEVSGVGGPDPSLRLVAEVPLGLPSRPHPRCILMGSSAVGSGRSTQRRVSASGATLFYLAPLEKQAAAECGEGSPNPYGVFARTAPDPAGPAVVTQLNVESGCASSHPCFGAALRSPTYDGASPSGRLAWFTTTQPLTDSDQDTGEGKAANDLYLAKLTESGQLEELVQASHGEASDPTPGAGAGVQGVVEISPDGTHAAFVATGALTTEANAGGAHAAPGADNLYVYDAQTGATKFVARLCSGAGESGGVEEAACPPSIRRGDSELWSDDLAAGPEVGFTPGGEFLLFTSLGRLVSGDTDSALDVYRYDFQTGRLIRLSFGHRGNDANGNDSAFPAFIARQNYADGQELGGPSGGPQDNAEDVSRSISADGSVVVFSTAAPLVSHDTNGGSDPGCGPQQTGCDVYEWEEEGHGSCAEGEAGSRGCLFLVSDGLDPNGASSPIVSASGKDIAFSAYRNLVPADTDGVGDVYDARVGGGFPPPPPPPSCREAGSPETCHANSTEQSLHPSFTSEEFVGPGNGETEIHCAKGRHKVKKHGQVRCVAKKHHKAKKHHRRANANRRAGR